MAPSFEPAIVTRLLERVDAHGTAGGELFLLLYAIRGVAVAVTALAHIRAGHRRLAQ
jgi:hypothetical protein